MLTVKVLGNYINGKFIRAKNPDDKIISKDPGDSGYRIGTFPVHKNHVEQAVAAARRASLDWSRRPHHERADYLRKFSAEVVNNRKELKELIAAETGKPVWDAEQEVRQVESRVETEIREGVRSVSPFKVGEIRFGVEGRCRYRPMGVAVVLAAAISPVKKAVSKIIPTLLAGNTMVYKPSKLAPATGQFIAKMFDDLGLPKGVFNLVQGDASIGESLATHPEVDVVSFSGSYNSGRRMLQAASQHPQKLVVLHMGGVSTAIVLDDAEVERALYETVCGSYLTSGQRYSSTGVILVHKAIVSDFVERFTDIVSRLKVGYAFDKDVFMGPLLSEQARERYLDLQERLSRADSQVILASKSLRVGRPGYYVSPAVHVVEEPENIDRYRPSGLSFGPDVVIVPVANEKAAVKLANSTEYPYSASIFCEDRKRFESVAEQLRYGLINHNLSTTEISTRLPLSGVGKCGNYRPEGVFAQRNYSYPVASIRATNRFDPDRMIPAFPKMKK
jgi:succinylglutamic semialdehyde dehydrogenase